MAAFDYISAGASALSGVAGLFASAEQRRNMKYQSDLALQNWRIQQDYNSPLNQRKRLVEAGINPNVAFSGVQTNAGSAPVPPEVAPYGSMSPAVSYSQQFLNTTSQTIAALAAASKSKSESKQIDELLAGQIKKLDLENVSHDINNQLNDFQLRLIRAYGHRKMSAETENAVVSYFRALQDLQNAAKTGKVLDEQVYQSKVDSLIKDLEKLGKDTEVRMLQETAKQLPARLAAEINEVNKRAEAASASAEASRASAESTRYDTAYKRQIEDVRKKLLSHEETKALFENANLVNDVLSTLADYDWSFEYVDQSQKIPPLVKRFVGYIRTIVRNSTIPLEDLLKGVFKKR